MELYYDVGVGVHVQISKTIKIASDLHLERVTDERLAAGHQ